MPGQCSQAGQVKKQARIHTYQRDGIKVENGKARSRAVASVASGEALAMGGNAVQVGNACVFWVGLSVVWCGLLGVGRWKGGRGAAPVQCSAGGWCAAVPVLSRYEYTIACRTEERNLASDGAGAWWVGGRCCWEAVPRAGVGGLGRGLRPSAMASDSTVDRRGARE